jgi:quercetin dioxygenase-like cupin family protein
MRRVVTATGPDGKSKVVSDGLPPVLFHFRDESDPHLVAAVRVTEIPGDLGAGGGVLGELWSADGASYADGTTDPLAAVDGWRVNCPPGASRFRTSIFSPGRQTAMHVTDTLDYDFVLEGTVTLVLSDGSETELSAGDAVVVPGTAHAWRAGPQGCRLGVVMIGTEGRGSVSDGL